MHDFFFQVNMTSAGATVSIMLRVSPIAPVVWTTISSTGNAAPIPITLNTTVLDHFWERTSGYNTTYAVDTTASCDDDGTSAAVSRSSEWHGSSAIGVNGVIRHTVRMGTGADMGVRSSTCGVTNNTSASLSFMVSAGATGAANIASVVRTSRDPACVPLPTLSGAAPPVCDLTPDALVAAKTIAAAVAGVPLADALAHHAAHWAAFYSASSVYATATPRNIPAPDLLLMFLGVLCFL